MQKYKYIDHNLMENNHAVDKNKTVTEYISLILAKRRNYVHNNLLERKMH